MGVYGGLVLRPTMFWVIMSLLLKQVTSAFFLLIGLIVSLSWHEWKESPIWMLVIGILCIFIGVVGVVLNIVQAEEEIDP
jgi:1,4-dihydroxy-2-naphthoate octaprenyltransferase